MTKIKKKDIEVKLSKPRVSSKPREIQDLPMIVHYEIVKAIKELIVTGSPKSIICESIRNVYSIDEQLFNKCYIQSVEHLQKSMVESQFLVDVIHQHVIDYEKIYSFFDDINFLSGKMKALHQKERLLGFHKENNVLEFNQNNTTTIEVDMNYDFSKLDQSERERVEVLLDKIQTKKGDK